MACMLWCLFWLHLEWVQPLVASSKDSITTSLFQLHSSPLWWKSRSHEWQEVHFSDNRLLRRLPRIDCEMEVSTWGTTKIAHLKRIHHWIWGHPMLKHAKIKKHFQEWNCETHGTSCPHQPTNMCERFLAIVTSKRWHLRGDKGALYHGSMVIYKIIASCPTVDARGPQNEEKNPSFLGGVLYEGAGILHAQSPLCQIPNHLGKSDANSTSYIYIHNIKTIFIVW